MVEDPARFLRELRRAVFVYHLLTREEAQGLLHLVKLSPELLDKDPDAA